MTTEEAISSIDDACDEWYACDPKAWEHIKTALARVTAERDRLIEAAIDRPMQEARGNDYKVTIGYHSVRVTGKKAAIAAVRAAAGLDAKEGA